MTYDITNTSGIALIQTKTDLSQIATPLSTESNDIVTFVDNSIDLSKYRPADTYGSVILSAFRTAEKAGNEYPVKYQVKVKIGSAYHLLEEIETTSEEYILKNLLLGQDYYVTAIDPTKKYLSQEAVINQTTLDTTLKLFILEVYNNATNEGTNITFFIKNVIDDHHTVTLVDQPTLQLKKNYAYNYTITGAPTTRAIVIRVLHFNGSENIEEFYEVLLNGEITPILSPGFIYYEPSRYFVNKNEIEPGHRIVAAAKSQQNSKDTLYKVNENGSYTKLVDYGYTTNFKTSEDIDRLKTVFNVYDITGLIYDNTIIVAGKELMKVISYSNVTNNVIVERGHQGTTPEFHLKDTILYVESIGTLLSIDETTDVAYTSSSFSSDTEMSDKYIIHAEESNYDKSILPANIKINDVYWVETSLKANNTLTLSLSYRNDEDSLSWYSDTESVNKPDDQYFMIDVYDSVTSNLISSVEYTTAPVEIDYSQATGDKIYIEIRSSQPGLYYNSYYHEVIVNNRVTNLTAINTETQSILLSWDVVSLNDLTIKDFNYQ